MTFTYTLGSGSDRDLVRLLIPDTDSVNVLFQDEELDALLALEAQDVRYAAAQALDTLASNQAMVLKVIKTLDLQTDGASVARALSARATALRSQSDSNFVMDVVEMVPNQFAARERIVDQWQRGG